MIKRKTVGAFLITALALSFVGTPAMANVGELTPQTEEDGGNLEPVKVTDSENIPVTPEAGTLPGDWFYFLDGLVESLQMTFTFNKESELELLNQFAMERLAELSTLSDSEKELYVQQLISDYTAQLDKMDNLIDEISEEESLSEESLEQIQDTVELGEVIVEENEELVGDEVTEEITETAIELEVKAEVVSHLNPAEVAVMRESGLGFGQIALLSKMAEVSGQTTAEILAVYETEKGMGKVAKSLGIHPSELKGNGSKGRTAADDSLLADYPEESEEVADAIETPEVTETPAPETPTEEPEMAVSESDTEVKPAAIQVASPKKEEVKKTSPKPEKVKAVKEEKAPKVSPVKPIKEEKAKPDKATPATPAVPVQPTVVPKEETTPAQPATPPKKETPKDKGKGEKGNSEKEQPGKGNSEKGNSTDKTNKE